MAEQGMKEQRQKIDDILSYAVIKKLVTPVTKTQAYKLGLVDTKGKIIRNPETDEEEMALSIFDKFMFRLKNLLGSKISQLNNFLYVHTLNNDFYNSLIVKGGVEKRAAVKRVKRDIEKLTEKYDMSASELLMFMMHEEIKDNTDKSGYSKKD